MVAHEPDQAAIPEGCDHLAPDSIAVRARPLHANRQPRGRVRELIHVVGRLGLVVVDDQVCISIAVEIGERDPACIGDSVESDAGPDLGERPVAAVEHEVVVLAPVPGVLRHEYIT